MRLIYEGKDITNAVEIHRADIIDNSGGRADSLELQFDDPNGLWSKWKPEKDNKVQVIDSGFDTGLMYVDELEQNRGFFLIRALSIPQITKENHSKGWEDVRFLEFAKEISDKYGFELKTYGIENHRYDRVDQNIRADFEFLSWRCVLEGYSLKICDGKVIIFDERYMENTNSARTIYSSDIDGKYRFLTTSTTIYGSCKLTYGSLQSEFKPINAPKGPTLEITNVQVTSQAEADRFSKNLLRYYNKHETTGSYTIKKDTGLAAAVNVDVKGMNMSDGKYFCNSVIHKLVEGKTVIKSRRPLQGY